MCAFDTGWSGCAPLRKAMTGTDVPPNDAVWPVPSRTLPPLLGPKDVAAAIPEAMSHTRDGTTMPRWCPLPTKSPPPPGQFGTPRVAPSALSLTSRPPLTYILPHFRFPFLLPLELIFRSQIPLIPKATSFSSAVYVRRRLRITTLTRPVRRSTSDAPPQSLTAVVFARARAGATPNQDQHGHSPTALAAWKSLYWMCGRGGSGG